MNKLSQNLSSILESPQAHATLRLALQGQRCRLFEHQQRCETEQDRKAIENEISNLERLQRLLFTEDTQNPIRQSQHNVINLFSKKDR